jgi:hypothetical protein
MAAAVKLGIEVYLPCPDGGRFDMIFLAGDELFRVQCKWAPRRKNVVAVPCYSCRRTATGFLYRSYTTEEIDAIAAYCPDTNACYLLPANMVAGKREVSLRLAPRRTISQSE